VSGTDCWRFADTQLGIVRFWRGPIWSHKWHEGHVQVHDEGVPLPALVGCRARRGGPSHCGCESAWLFQFHEEQDENRPDPDGHGKLHQRGVPQSTSSGQEICRHQHGESSEYPKKKSAFPVHVGSASLVRLVPRLRLRERLRLYTCFSSPPGVRADRCAAFNPAVSAFRRDS